jgi:hypothetical protein
VELVDADQQQLGHVQIARQAALLLARFSGAAFRRVAQLFRDFEAAVDVQALHAIETPDTTIAARAAPARPSPWNLSPLWTCKFGVMVA